MKHVYAYAWLLQIKIDLMELTDKLDEAITKIKAAIIKYQGKVDDSKFEIKQRREFVFTNSFQYGLTAVLRKFDYLSLTSLKKNGEFSYVSWN